MQRKTLIAAIDLGTSTTTASHIIVNDSYTPDGELHRDRGRAIVNNIRDWPGSNNGDVTGNVCVPTDLIYTRVDGKLMLWGFRAQQYLDDPYPEIPPEDVFVVEHIKLLLQDPNDAPTSTVASQRYRVLRQRLTTTLGKQPEDVFEDFMNEVIGHVIASANRKYLNGISSCKIELVLAFPSGWPEFIHTKVSAIAARATAKAITINKLQNIAFGIENVYTVSETLCGVKEWLRDTIAEATTSLDPPLNGTNLDGLNEGDCFLPVDIGGGTGCLTPLQLVTKDPLVVDQLEPTQSLEVSGEAVQAEFEAWLRPRITSADYPGDIPRLISQICRKFKEEKKECGLPPRPGSTKWNIAVPTLQINRDKGFENGCMRIERSMLDRCFEPVIDILETAIDQVLRNSNNIKAVIFLGQFGSSSEYLRQRMKRSHISRLVKLRHSESGKLNVVKGAISERLFPNQTFVRRFKTKKSFGALVTWPFPGPEADKIFPNAIELGAVRLESDIDGPRLKVVEWAIAKGTILENGKNCDIGVDGRRHHTWPFNEKNKDGIIEFEDTIVISDEDPPPPQIDGKSFTLWTEAHENNQLVLNGQRMQVQQIPFSWSLAMSQKIDAGGNLLGPYERADLEYCWFPEEYRKGRRRSKLRILHYELEWDITEMQIKVWVRPLFPNPVGPLLKQLAKERPLEAHELAHTGESRSTALERDIEISSTVISRPAADILHLHEEIGTRTSLDDLSRSAGNQLLEYQARRYYQEQEPPIGLPRSAPSPRLKLYLGPRNNRNPLLKPFDETANQVGQTSNFELIDISNEDCYTCKSRRKKCDGTYTLDEASGQTSCGTCLRHGVHCQITQPPRWNDTQLRAEQVQWVGLARAKKRKTSDGLAASHNAPRDRPTTVDPAQLSLDQGSLPDFRSVAPVAAMGS